MLASMFVLCTYVQAPVPIDERYRPNVERGRAYLFEELAKERRLGDAALGTMALLKTAPIADGKKEKSPALQRLAAELKTRIDAAANELNGQEGNYIAAVSLMALLADDPPKHDAAIRRLAKLLVDRQLQNGGWAYPGGSPVHGDTSQTQYCLLALWEASNAGLEVAPRVWDSAFDWHLRTQDFQANNPSGGPGGFAYHPLGVRAGGAGDAGTETCTMSVAGLGSMLICQSKLPGLKSKLPKHLLIEELVRLAVDAGDGGAFLPKVSTFAAQNGIARAEAWVARFTPFRAPYQDTAKTNYYLYGLERVAALRGNGFAMRDWYAMGGEFLKANQNANGSWTQSFGGIADTAFAIMFLHRAMGRTLEKPPKISALPRSNAVAGEGGLPDANGTAIGALRRQDDRYRSQPETDVDGLIRFLEDPNAVVMEEAARQVELLAPAQLTELVKKAAGERKLRQWAYDKRPTARAAALTLLARRGDSRSAPILIDALADKNAVVYNAARDGLRYLSRNADSFGLPVAEKRTPEAVQAGVRRARAWFDGLKLEVAAAQQYSPPVP